MKKLLLKYSLMSVLGCSLYLMIEIFYRGFSYRLMGLSGALLFVLISSLNNWFSWDMDLLLQCGIGATLITGLEAVLGNIDYYVLHINMWDYSSLPYNALNSKICLLFWFLWFFLSLLIILTGDSFDYYVFHEDQRPYYRLLGKVRFRLPERKCFIK